MHLKLENEWLRVIPVANGTAATAFTSSSYLAALELKVTIELCGSRKTLSQTRTSIDVIAEQQREAWEAKLELREAVAESRTLSSDLSRMKYVRAWDERWMDGGS